MLALNGQRLTLNQIADVAAGHEHVLLAEEALRLEHQEHLLFVGDADGRIVQVVRKSEKVAHSAVPWVGVL